MRPHTHASFSASQAPRSGRPYSSRQKRIPAKGAAPASALPRPGAGPAIKRRAAASQPCSKRTSSVQRRDESAAPDGSRGLQPCAFPAPRTLHLRRQRGAPPRHSAPPGDTEAGPKLPSLAGTRREQEEPTCWPRGEPPFSCYTWPCSPVWGTAPRPPPRVSGLELRRGQRAPGSFFTETAVRAPLGQVGGDQFSAPLAPVASLGTSLSLGDPSQSIL